MNREEAIKATKDGATAACISAGLTTVFTLLGIFLKADGAMAFFDDPWIFLDIAIILLCAFGMYKKSRAAAIVAFVHYAGCKLIMAAGSGANIGGSIIGAIIFLYYYGRATIGAFVYHRIEKRENPEYRGVPLWIKIIGITGVIVVGGLLALGVMSEIGFTPVMEVRFYDEIREKDINNLLASGIITSDDKVEGFYSQGFMSILEEGNILLDDRITQYYTDENNEIVLYEIDIDEITTIELETQGDTLNDSVYIISTDDPEVWARLYLSTEAGGDEKFVKILQEKIDNINANIDNDDTMEGIGIYDEVEPNLI